MSSRQRNVSQNIAENVKPHAKRPVLPDLSSGSLKIIALGGLCEIGKNTTAIACDGDIMLVDAGLAFPSDDMPGVDLVLPDVSFLVAHQEKIRGLAVTHGHEDHIGGIPFLLKSVSVPTIYGPALALGLLDGKLKEFGLQDRTVMHKVQPRKQVRMGCFTVKFIRCTHSIADSYSLIIETPAGTIVHTGDFKFDFTPVDGEAFDIASLAAAAQAGILLLMSDSTNVEREGYTPSERTVWKKLDEVFANSTQRIIVTTFASNVHRIRQILQATMKYDRKVAVLGRSMLNLARIARELGYMNFPDGLILPVDEINKLPANKVVILTTGSQGEPLSALTRIANDNHKQIKIVAGDTVIISATPIPGNERLISNTINSLFLRGANVIYGRDAGVHVSGHGCREEQKLMLNICRPRYFMPIHGEYRMLVNHAALAATCGIKPENTFVMNNGDVLEISETRAAVSGHVKAGIILVDASRAWEIDESIVSDRKHLAQDGMVVIALTIDSKHRLLCDPDITTKGLILPKEVSADELSAALQKVIAGSLKDEQITFNLKSEDLRAYLTGAIGRYFQEKFKSSPLVQILVQEVSKVPSSRN